MDRSNGKETERPLTLDDINRAMSRFTPEELQKKAEESWARAWEQYLKERDSLREFPPDEVYRASCTI